MLRIYDRNEKLVTFLNNQGAACPFYDDKMNFELANGAITYEFRVPMNHEDALLIQEGGAVVAPDHAGRLRIFDITRLEETRSGNERYKIVNAEYGWVELNGDYIRPRSYENLSAKSYLVEALTGTRWEPGEVEWFNTKDIEVSQHTTVLAFLHTVAEEFGAEIVFRVSLDRMGRVSGRYVDLLKKRGQWSGRRFTYDRGLEKATKIHDRTDVATALIPVGSGDDDGNFTTIEEAEWIKENGDPVTKIKGQDWIGDDDARGRWGRDGRHVFDVFEYDTDDPILLMEKAWEELQKRKEGYLRYEADVTLIESEDDIPLEIGDTVEIYDKTFRPELMLEGRVIELEISLSNPTENKVALGHYRELERSGRGARLRELSMELMKNKRRFMQSGETIHKAPRPPDNPKSGDLWLDTSGDIDSWYRWDGSKWKQASIGEEAIEEEVNNKVVEYAEKKVHRGPDNPDPAEVEDGDLWLDTAVSPPVWRQLRGTEWVKFTRTDLNELLGQLASGQLQDGAVTSDKIQNNAINNEKLADLAVEAEKLADSAVTAEKIANLAVGTAAIQDGSITNAKIKNLHADKITSGVINAERIKVGPQSQFESGYDPSEKAGLDEATHKMIPTPTMENGAYSTITGGCRIEIDNDVHIGHATVDAETTGSFSYEITKETGEVVHTGTVQVTRSGIFRFEVGALLEGPDVYIFKLTNLNNLRLYRTTSSATEFPYDAGSVRITDGITSSGNTSSFYYGAYRFEIAGKGVVGISDRWTALDNVTIDGGNIYAGSITAQQLQTGIITTEFISSAGIDAGVLTSGYAALERVRGGTLALGGTEYGDGELTVLRDNETNIAEITKDKIEFGEISVGEINSPSVIGRNDEDYRIYVRQSDGDDDNEGTGGWSDAKETIQGAIDAIPKFNNGNVEIYLTSSSGTYYEDLTFEGFFGSGSITLDMRDDSKFLRGHIRCFSNTIDIELRNCYVQNPYTYSSTELRESCLYVRGSSSVTASNCYFEGGLDRNMGYTVLAYNSYVGLYNTNVNDGNTASIGSLYGARVDVYNCMGRGGARGIRVSGASIVGGSGTCPRGDISNVYTTDGGIYDSSHTEDLGRRISSSNQPSDPPPSSGTKVKVYESNSSGSWRTTYGWRTDNDHVYQGSYGYGTHRGLWFFPDSSIRSDLSGKTIKKVRLRVGRRTEGGATSTQTATFRPHNYSSQPSGTPSYGSGTTNKGFRQGERKWINLPIAWGEGLRDGSVKGIMIYAGSSPYMIFNPRAQLEITYE